MDNSNYYGDYESEYGNNLENKSLVNKQVCGVCSHKDVCFIYKEINEGKKWYQEFFGDGVSCPYFKNSIKVETNIYDKVERYEDCTVEILTNTITGAQSIGWFKNDNPPMMIGDVEDEETDYED